MLIKKYGEEFFRRNIILNANRSYHHEEDNGGDGDWFEVPKNRPNEYSMAYDIVLGDQSRYPFFEFKLNSTGVLMDSTSFVSFSNSKPANLISRFTADSVAERHGLTNKDRPFTYRLEYEPDSLHPGKGRLELRVNGRPFDQQVNRNEITEHFYYILLDAWTGEFIRKKVGNFGVVVD